VEQTRNQAYIFMLFLWLFTFRKFFSRDF